jgi:predicted Fe-S protein YdhL (DUF1289 family)
MTQEALKLALDFVETVHVGEWVGSIERQLEVITAVKKALAQEQEPVAWVVYSSAENDIVWADKGKRLKQNTPLYTTPPQRSESSGKPSAWVGLTDEEKLELWEISRAALPRYATYSSLVEAKLKEKNT